MLDQLVGFWSEAASTAFPHHWLGSAQHTGEGCGISNACAAVQSQHALGVIVRLPCMLHGDGIWLDRQVQHDQKLVQAQQHAHCVDSVTNPQSHLHP